MFSQLVHHTTSILRARPFIPQLPPSLGTLQFPLIFRNNSWSSQSSRQANWSHLNDLYSRGAVNGKAGEHHSSPDERWATQSRSRMAILRPPKGPYAGRSVEVKSGNVADALNKLQYTLQRNRVVSELRLTARHEKKGYKRRRLSSQRWRRRFAHEVRLKVQLVNKIRARGA